MFIVSNKEKPRNNETPAILSGYGGFGISVQPYYGSAVAAWLEMGGVYAVANIRGGNEYGTEWHDKGKQQNKQNSFDDFTAAAKHLTAQGYTSPDRLALEGESNGGLLVASVLIQHPEIAKAAVPISGVMDMIRFPRNELGTSGEGWIDEYGNPQNQTDFNTLKSYSPYHNVDDGAPYPSILFMVAANDDRVSPSHSYKAVAAFQASKQPNPSDNPFLLFSLENASHGGGSSTNAWAQQNSFQLAYLIRKLFLDNNKQPAMQSFR